MICAVCRRQARGFGWFDARAKIADPRRDQSRRWLCSLACQYICHRRRGMIDPTCDERAAMEHAVDLAGEYIESVGRTDLMTWSKDEFMTLIEVIATAFTDRLRELADRPPEVPWPDAGIGIPTGTVIGVDIDVRAEADLASQLERLARERLGDTPAVRFGMLPKRLLVYRANEPLAGIKAHPIEVLGHGQQFVAFAEHPETGQPYT